MRNKKDISGIYCILNKANGKRYIGSSKSVYYRWKKEHLRSLQRNKHCNDYLQNAWNKYGEEQFEFQVLEECSIEELPIKEEYWMEQFKSYEKNKGYNLTRIVEGNHVMHEETKKKMIISWQDPEIRAKRVEGMKNCTDEERSRKLSEHAKQQYQDPKYVALKSARMKQTWEEKGDLIKKKMKDAWDYDKHFTLESCAKLSNSLKEYAYKNAKPILQYDLEGNFIREWLLQKDAVREYGVHVNSVLKGRRKHCRGFIFRYK